MSLVFLLSNMVAGSKKELLCHQTQQNYMEGHINICFSGVKSCINGYNNQLWLQAQEANWVLAARDLKIKVCSRVYLLKEFALNCGKIGVFYCSFRREHCIK